MDVVLVHPNLGVKGGAEKVVLKIAQKYNPVIYTSINGSDFKDFDVRVKKRKLDSSFSLFTGFDYKSLKIKDYDVINAHWTPSHWIRRLNPNVLWYCHSPSRAVYDLYNFRMKEYSFPFKIAHHFYSKWYKSIDKNVVSKIERIAVNSTTVRDRVSKYYGRESIVINPGVDLKEFKCGDYDRYFFIPGRITSTKNIEFCISAFKMANLNGFKLIIAGSCNEPNYLAKIRSLCGKNIELLVNVSDDKMSELYSNCYAVLFAGINEDFGFVPIEAMASSKPIISINQGGPRETIVDGKSGWLVSNIIEMSDKIKLLANNLRLVEEIGEFGRKHSLNYSWRNFFNKFDKALKEAAKR